MLVSLHVGFHGLVIIFMASEWYNLTENNQPLNKNTKDKEK